MSGSSSTKAPASTNAGANPGDLPLEKEELIEKLKNGVNEEEEETNDRKKIDGQEEASLSRQVLACFSVFMMSISLGASSGFSGVAIPQLKDPDNTGFVLTEETLSWFASLQTFAMVFTCVLGGFMGQQFGRKLSLLLIAPLFSTGFICQAAASDQALLLFGRFVCGVAGGLSCGPTGVYIAEVTTTNYRTTFGSGISGSYNIGMVLIFTLGAFCHWRVLAAVSATFPIIGFILIVFIPESPAWFVTKGRNYEAHRSLRWLRGPNYSEAQIEMEFQILKESYADQIKSSQQSHEQESSSFKRGAAFLVHTLRRGDVWKPLCIVLVLFLLQQFSGMSSLSYYAVVVLVQTGSSVDEYLATIIFGLVRFGGQILGSFLLIRIRRKILLVTSCLFVSLGMSLLAASIYLNSDDGGQHSGNRTIVDTIEERQTTGEMMLGWLPLFAIVIVALFYHIGLGPIPWSFSAELFPLDVRSVMSGISNCIANIYIFTVVKTFPTLSRKITVPGTYWLYSSVSLVTIIFGIFFLPETKGKRLDQISDGFNKDNKIKNINPDPAQEKNSFKA